MKMGIISTPGVAVDGVLKVAGYVRSGKRAEYVAAPAPPAASASAAQGAAAQASPPVEKQEATAAAVKPRLVEIGSTRCLASIEMAKVLDALRKKVVYGRVVPEQPGRLKSHLDGGRAAAGFAGSTR